MGEVRQMSYEVIRQRLDEQPLFEDKTWRLSPQAWPLTSRQVRELEQIGQACLDFYRALELLYLRASEGKNLLRNRPLKAPWVAEYLDRGKPEELTRHARSKRLRGTLPPVLRPDLLMTESGFALTEMDSVPGGIGLTAFLNRIYGGEEGDVIGGGDRMLELFYEALASRVPEKPNPVIALLVSDESAIYRPEMDWLAGELQGRGYRVYCFHPSEVMPLGNTLCMNLGGNPEQIDVVYRFWELFDLANVPIAEYILEAWEESTLEVAPPMRSFQEEKLNLALFHHHRLEDFWRENLSRQSFKVLHRIVPKSWIIDAVDLPPSAVLAAPTVGGRPIWDWRQLSEASQKERNLILKISGYSERAWGARSVVLGSDVSREAWQEGLQEALESAPLNPHICQEYRKPMRLKHPVYTEPGKIYEMEGRIRLCPYYFPQGDRVNLGGVLATFCPADKKIIHGMSDAAMLPCILT